MLELRRIVLTSIAVLAIASVGIKAANAAPRYTLSKIVSLGGGINWDYLYFDAFLDDLFVSHGNELTVLDARTGAIAGHVGGLDGSHGIAIDDAGGFGYADSAKTRTVAVFDLKTFKIIKILPALMDADGMVFDPVSVQVFIAGGDAEAVLPVNTKTNEPAKPIGLGGAPEFLVTDGKGALYLNINDKNEIVRIDTRTDTVTARWTTAPCERPTGLAMDIANRRLFSSCQNATMVVVDADNGKIVATLPIGKGTDAAGFDPRRKLAFSSNRDGTLSVIREVASDSFKVLTPLKTALGARTMALDPVSGNIFLVTAKVKSARAPKFAGGSPLYDFVPGTAEALVFVPTP